MTLAPDTILTRYLKFLTRAPRRNVCDPYQHHFFFTPDSTSGVGGSQMALLTGAQAGAGQPGFSVNPFAASYTVLMVIRTRQQPLDTGNHSGATSLGFRV